MIVTTAELAGLQGTVAMVDGGFDPLHAGHIAYFAAAAELGVPVLCNVASDAYVAGKHRLLLTQPERGVVIDAIRHLDYVHLSQSTTEEVLLALRPRFYAKGADWRGRLPADQLEICERAGIEIAYLDTVTHSSSQILARYLG